MLLESLHTQLNNSAFKGKQFPYTSDFYAYEAVVDF